MNEPVDRHSGAVAEPTGAVATSPVARGDAGRRQIIVAEQQLDSAVAQAVREACVAAGADHHAWTPTDRIDALAGQAALAIGSIAPGSRSIPGDLASLVTDQLPGLPLLLLAQEALVRPVVTLHEGLVTLIDPAPVAARLASCIRALLADNPPAATAIGAWWPALGVPRGAAAPRRREYRVGASWIGVLDGLREVPGTDAAPAVWLRTGAGVSAVITTSREVPAPETGDLGGAVAFVQLEATEARLDWFFLVPHGGAAMALFSAQRFPPFTDLGRLRAQGAVGSRRLAAAPGDLAVAVAPFDALGPLSALEIDPSLGGAAVLDLLEARSRRAAVACSCLVIEVR